MAAPPAPVATPLVKGVSVAEEAPEKALSGFSLSSSGVAVELAGLSTLSIT